MYDTIVCGVSRAESGRYAAQVAHELARTFGATLHLVMAYPGSPEPTKVAGAGEPPGRTEAEQFLAQLCAAAGDSPHTHALLGDPAAAILQVAREANADLIVVGNKGMRGTRRVLGSVPNTVTHQAECAVHIVNTT
ncbi:MAG: universal stress protein [Acidimicrobiia bacterium]